MELNYRKLGEGTPLIIIHGLYGASDNWASVGKVLAEKFQVWMIDQRNHGRSPHAPEHSYELMRDDLLEFMDHHQIQKAIILGHSMGGKTAMFFAAKYPERVKHLVVVDIAPKSYLLDKSAEQGTIDHKNIVAAMGAIDFEYMQTRKQIDELLSHNLKDIRVRQFLMKNLRRNTEGEFEWCINIEALDNNLEKILEGLNPEDFKQGNAVTGFPVLFLRGGNSNYIQAEDINLITLIFPNAELVTVPNAGHWVHAEQPELLIKNVLYFVEA